jgi:hypothetical protein
MRIPLKSIPVAFAVLFAITLTVIAQNAKPPVSITINAPQTVKVGSKIRLDVTMTNISNHVVHGHFEDLAHGELNFDFDVRDSQGQPVPQTCYMKGAQGADRGSCPEFIFRTHKGYGDDLLKPGETITASADLIDLYDLQPGTYTVQVSWFEGRTRYRNPQQPRPPNGTAVAQSNIVSITVTP